MRTVEPAAAEDIVEALAAATRSNERVVIRGAGTKIDWVAAPDGDILLATTRLNRVVAHRHGDLTATVEAGAVLDEVNRVMARHGQWIPLDPPWSDRSTIGGIVATNESGPRRHRYGAPRDLIIGIEIARADGVRAKAGGIVVKNVAGYDLARLVTGSYGCLGVILSVTFKLYPRPPASATVVVDGVTPVSTWALAAAIEQNQLTPTALEVQTPPLRMLVRFESIEASVEQQSGRVAHLAEVQGAPIRVVRGEEEEHVWRSHVARPWNGPGAVAKLTCLPADLPAVLDLMTDPAIDAIGRAGVGVLLVRVDGRVPSQSRVIEALRRRAAPGRGSVVLLRASGELRAAVGAWGPMGDGFGVMQSIKRAFDPKGTLNPGRGPGGL